MTRAVLLLALLAGACASGQAAPISYGGGAAAQTRAPARIEDRRAPAPVETRAPPRAPVEPVTPDWAAGDGTPLSTWALQPGDAQPYDPSNLPRTHRVGANESLYDIASRYQVPLRALIDQNSLEPPYALTPGRELRLPPPRFHTVAQGERFEDVARSYNVDARSLALLNRMQAPYRVRAGDRIVLPAMARAEIASQPAAAPRVAAPTSGSPAVQAANAHLALPMQGRVVARFGAQASGVRLDGIEIAGREGDRISAAADGDVVYAGSDLPAYGELVLVRHANDLVTAYAYTRRARVREGQRVRAGEAIAELGGRADGSPRLLFQVRQGSTPVDPGPLLGLSN